MEITTRVEFVDDLHHSCDLGRLISVESISNVYIAPLIGKIILHLGDFKVWKTMDIVRGARYQALVLRTLKQVKVTDLKFGPTAEEVSIHPWNRKSQDSNEQTQI